MKKASNTSPSPSPVRSFSRYAKNYVLIAGLLLGGWILSQSMSSIVQEHFVHAGSNAALLSTLFEMVLIAVFGFLAYELAKPTIIPSFVLAILIGMLLREPMSAITGNGVILNILTTIGAIFILFGGGLETPFSRFKALIWPILAVSVVGMILTAYLFSLFFSGIAPLFGAVIPLAASILLGAALASTDPAAVIPSLKPLVFKNPNAKHIAVSETAITDVVGPVLVATLLTILLSNDAPTSLHGIYAMLASSETLLELGYELFVGCLAGLGGFAILHLWNGWKAKAGVISEADSALFFAVPLLCYGIAVYFHGSGFLAVFIAGLLFQLEDHFQHVEHYFNHTLEGFMKPLIFMLLGAIVDVNALLQTAPLGIAMALLFMFVVRPIAVFITLSPFMALGKNRLAFRDLLFLSLVRETGVIAAVLVIGLGVSGIAGAQTVVAIGLWIILLTLIIEPPITPPIARRLGVADAVPVLQSHKAKGPVAVLCSRGLSFTERMRTVVDWADEHTVKNITLLHCPEDKYSKKYIKEMEDHARALFLQIEKERAGENKKKLHFEFLGHPGNLEKNIESLVRQEDVAIIFVGAKMLDYRLEDVKKLQVPFIFLS